MSLTRRLGQGWMAAFCHLSIQETEAEWLQISVNLHHMAIAGQSRQQSKNLSRKTKPKFGSNNKKMRWRQSCIRESNQFLWWWTSCLKVQENHKTKMPLTCKTHLPETGNFRNAGGYFYNCLVLHKPCTFPSVDKLACPGVHVGRKYVPCDFCPYTPLTNIIWHCILKKLPDAVLLPVFLWSGLVQRFTSLTENKC